MRFYVIELKEVLKNESQEIDKGMMRKKVKSVCEN